MTRDLKPAPEQKAEWERKRKAAYEAFCKRRAKQHREAMERLASGWLNETLPIGRVLKTINTSGDKLALFLEAVIGQTRTKTHVAIFLQEYLAARKLREDD